MRGFGEKCPECDQIMQIERRLRYSPDKQLAVLACFTCDIYCRVDLKFKSIRSYRNNDKARLSPSAEARKQTQNMPFYGREVEDSLFGFGEFCPKCGASMRIRTSRKLSDTFKIVYLRCTCSSCKEGQKIELKFTY